MQSVGFLLVLPSIIYQFVYTPFLERNLDVIIVIGQMVSNQTTRPKETPPPPAKNPSLGFGVVVTRDSNWGVDLHAGIFGSP